MVLLATVDLGWIILKDLLFPPIPLLEIDKLLELFDTILTYITGKTLHAEMVLLMGAVAIARKFVILELKTMDALSLIGIAAIILSLTSGCCFVKLIARDGSLAPRAAPDLPAGIQATASPKPV